MEGPVMSKNYKLGSKEKAIEDFFERKPQKKLKEIQDKLKKTTRLFKTSLFT